MPKRPPQDPTAFDLTVGERVLLFCAASGTNRQRAGAPGDWLALTVRGRGGLAGHVTGAVIDNAPPPRKMRRRALTKRPADVLRHLPDVSCLQHYGKLYI